MSGKVEGLVAKWRAEAQEAMSQQVHAALAISDCAEELAEALAADAQSVAAVGEVIATDETARRVLDFMWTGAGQSMVNKYWPRDQVTRMQELLTAALATQHGDNT